METEGRRDIVSGDGREIKYEEVDKSFSEIYRRIKKGRRSEQGKVSASSE
jgi:hypothetical protein